VLNNMAVKVDRKICTGCGTCTNVCPVDAITVE
jgi:NAD-dependent dihydropyrimidine dehydrogenase PreA subunit